MNELVLNGNTITNSTSSSCWTRPSYPLYPTTTLTIDTTTPTYTITKVENGIVVKHGFKQYVFASIQEFAEWASKNP